MPHLNDPKVTLDKDIIPDLAHLNHMELFALIRSLEAIYNVKDKVGDEIRLDQTFFKFGQSAHLAFQSKQVNEIKKLDKYLKIDIKGFGLFGTNGPLPLHISEYIYEKQAHVRDRTFNDFVDIFHNRLIALFYKAWRVAQPIVSLDQDDGWQFSRFVASSIGIAQQQHSQPEVSQYTRMYYANYLMNKHMPVDHLKTILANFFSTTVEIKENIGQWVSAKEFSTHLGAGLNVKLGQGLLIGENIFDATQKFRISLGPISPEKYIEFLPKRALAKKIISWVDQYCRHQYEWDLEIIVDKNLIQQQTLGQGLSLGFTSWLGKPKHHPKVIIQY